MNPETIISRLQHNVDNNVNITSLCKVLGKQLKNFLRNTSTKELIARIRQERGIEPIHVGSGGKASWACDEIARSILVWSGKSLQELDALIKASVVEDFSNKKRQREDVDMVPIAPKKFVVKCKCEREEEWHHNKYGKEYEEDMRRAIQDAYGSDWYDNKGLGRAWMEPPRDCGWKWVHTKFTGGLVAYKEAEVLPTDEDYDPENPGICVWRELPEPIMEYDDPRYISAECLVDWNDPEQLRKMMG